MRPLICVLFPCLSTKSGASNLHELRSRIGPHLMRKTKEECLDIPHLTRRTVKVDVIDEIQHDYNVLIGTILLSLS